MKKIGIKVQILFSQVGVVSTLVYKLNDFFVLIQFLRVYFVFKYFISLSYFKSSRSARICRMFGEKSSDIFTIRCFFDCEPFKLIALVLFCCLFFYSYSLRLIERVFIITTLESEIINSFYPNFDDIYNCIWCVFISMMTVGYGDYYPTTFFGRIVIVLTIFSGLILNCLVTVALFKLLAFSTTENKVYTLLERLRIREEITFYNKQVIRLLTHKYVLDFKNRKSKDILEKQRNNELIEKINVDLTNFLKKTIQIKK